FIERRGLEAVGTGQVDDAEGTPAARSDQSAFLAFDRDARVIGVLLATARQTVEERGLAAVGDADEREGELRRGQRRGRGGVHCGGPDLEISTHTLCASRRRSASVVLPTRTTNGSRPGRASARIST